MTPVHLKTPLPEGTQALLLIMDRVARLTDLRYLVVGATARDILMYHAAELDDRPQPEPFGLLAVILVGGGGVGHTGEPRTHCREVVIGGNLAAPVGAVHAVAPVEFVGQIRRVERAPRDGNGCHAVGLRYHAASVAPHPPRINRHESTFALECQKL
ncbi:hypothetical protein ACFPTO_25085 [Paraburkholderia denitrificans]|uniref:Poly A polymerase head domain-containing protein n=1 Tax=Paraburkholderia denitrificans TaxID=694025 RepID=A0ABW0JFU4_9BURK